MQRIPLGSTGFAGSRVGLGTMPLAIEKRPSEAASIAVIHAALEAGINWLDTADAYGLDDRDIGYGERLVARALASAPVPRDQILVATKGGYIRPRGEWLVDAHPKRIIAACEASLRALGVECIGLYFLHGPDARVYYPDSVGALLTLQRAGKIEHAGLSNVDVGHIADACQVMPIAAVQNRCNVFDRHCFANGVIAACARRGIAFVAHSPVGGHTGVTRIAAEPSLGRVAARHGVTPHQVALAWLLASAPGMFVIPGATKPASVAASVAAERLVLSADDHAELRRAFPDVNPLVKQLVGVRASVRHLVRNGKARARQLVGR